MGIDVWVLRDRTLGNPQGTVLVEAENSEFHICFLNYGSFGVCLPLEIDQEVISPMARRFIDDIALCVKGSAKVATLSNVMWPISKRQFGDQVGKTAEEVVLHGLGSLPALVLVFGNGDTNAIPGLRGNESGTGVASGQRILALESIDELIKGAKGKRNLWQTLNELRDVT